jgi:ABC-type antimicrobial peptide transport system permease subunit
MQLARKLIFRSLRFYASTHLGTLLGVTVAAAVLVGALAVGDCVRISLQDMAQARIGQASFALASTDHFFRSALADNLRNWSLHAQVASVLQLPGTASTPDGSARANQVQILGVNHHFWAMAQDPPTFASLPTPWVVLNQALARQLHVHTGDTVVLHVQKPSLLSQEAPLSPQEDVSTGLRLTVADVVSDSQFGRFSLQANQIPPLNAFVPLGFLQEKVELEGRANLLLTAGPSPVFKLPEVLRQHWTLADAGLEVRPTANGLELRSEQVFIDPAVARAVESIVPPPGPEPILTYFVNELRDGSRTTPYSMVTAMPEDIPDNEIIINQWLADDLQAKPGDSVRLSYFVLGNAHRLEEKHESFRVHSVVPMEGLDRTLMPDFPGIAKAEKTENWDAGFAIDLRKIRPKDEQYWKQYRGTPKAFVTLAAGQKMWGNRFGNLTALRIPGDKISEENILDALDPADTGLVFQPIRERALAASSQSEDFGGLFLGFSFFLIVAALILMALLFQFGLEKRATEIGILLALGWRPRAVRRIFLFEGLTLAVLGGLLGAAGGVLYARGILYGLVTLWRDAVADSPLQFHVTFQTLATGVVASIIVSTIVIWFALRAQTKRPARELLERGHELEIPPRGRHWAGWVAVISGLGALIMVGAAKGRGDVEAFFGGGALLLIAGIAGAAFAFRRLAERRNSRPLTLTSLGWRGCTRRRNRSVATIALLASGSFLIVAVAANKLDATLNSRQRSSGTGGFALIGQSALPIVQDLNTKAGRDFFNLDDKSLTGVQFVPFRVHDGDDASCLNLNRAQTPRLLGVDPKELQRRGAFTFSQLIDPAYAKNPWDMLTAFKTNADEIPAVGDEASIEWALHKKIGDTLDYTDEHGKPFKVRLVGALANSVLQGSLIVDRSAFLQRFPGETGYRFFLIDAPPDQAASISLTLSRALQDRGLELTSAAQRLNAFNAVQNTYLDTFQVLGGLGLLLGSAGLGVVVLRNVLERRGEMAVLSAVGFRPRALRWLVLSEHVALEFLGLAIGIVAALLAVLPALISASAPLSYLSLGVTLALVAVNGVIWAWAAARLALRGELWQALRNE